MVPEHPNIHDILGGFFLVGHLEVGVPVAWQAQGAIAGTAQDVQLLAWGQEAAIHGNQLLGHIQIAMQYVLQPLARVAQGDKQDMPQILGLCAWVQAVGCHGRV